MNILEKLMNVFRKRERVEPRLVEPSHGFGVGELNQKVISHRGANHEMELWAVELHIKRTKAAIAEAKSKKKKVAHLFDRLIDLKARQLKLRSLQNTMYQNIL